jgi:signal transduction histidine kinase
VDIAARVLIIDDEEAARYGIRRALETQNYILREACDGAAALDLIAGFSPDVIISDINMPVMDGLTLLQHVNREEDRALVILITAYGSEEVAIEALRRGAYDYLAKPFNIEALRASVRNAVDNRRLIQQNRAYNRQLVDTLEQLKRSQAALVQAEKIGSMGKLVAGVAHEINTPLGVLKSATDTIERATQRFLESFEKQAPETVASLKWLVDLLGTTVDQSHAACERIEHIVTKLRTFAQLDRAEYQRAHIHEGLESTIALLGHEMEGIEVQCDYGEIPEIDCSPQQLNQVFMNLLLNAIDAIRQSDSAKGSIHIATRQEGEFVCVEIEDTGCGIPPENLDKIFDPGFTTKGTQVGTGLGLPICYQIVQGHQGRIEVASRPDQGTRFKILLPVRPFL